MTLHEPRRCRNCGAPLAGPFCAACGQEAHGSARSMATLLHDAWHVLTHVDGRLWRTLGALAFRPGVLTGEYLDDRRARWLPPFRLYLVLSIVFFALASAGSGREAVAVEEPGGAARRAKARAKLEEAARELDAAGQGALASVVRGAAGPELRVEPGPVCSGLGELGGARAGAALARACERAAADGGRALGRAFLANVPKTMLLFLPLAALALYALFGRSRRFYVEHLVLALHLQSAAFLLASAALAAGALASLVPALDGLASVARVALVAYVAWYVFRALRVVYGEGRAATGVKLVALGLAYAVLLGATLAGTALWSAMSA